MRRFASTVVLAVLAAMLQVLGAGAASALTLPKGFQVLTYQTGQAANNLTNFVWLDDGGLLTSGKEGTVTFTPPGGLSRVVTKVPGVRAASDHGMLGLALGNDYKNNGQVYLTYDKGDPAGTGFGMVEEWRADPPADPTSFTRTRTLVDGSTTSPPLAQTTRNHGIDSIVVAPDDTLFVSIGDDSTNNGDPNALRAQDLGQPYGKLLHLTSEGLGVPANPYYSAAAPGSWRSMVYASGLRNPFRFDLDPRSGLPHLGDVGLRTVEEINTLRPGTNAGWPCIEGAGLTGYSDEPVCQALLKSDSAQAPISSYQHDGQGAAVVGGVHYTGTSYPAQYQYSYFYGDAARKQLWTIATDPAGALTRGPESGGFATDAGTVVAFQTGPNGDITYADLTTGTVRRLVYTEGNRAPVAHIATTTDPENRTVTFSAADSYDLDGDALTYDWVFEEGAAPEPGEQVAHTYPDDSPADVTLHVRDELGAVGTATIKVYPGNNTPQLTLEAPTSGTYGVGDRVELTATAFDKEDGPLTVDWDTALLHCPFAGSCHLHPDDTIFGTGSYTRPFTDHGSDTTMVVTARTKDSTGATSSASFEAKPALRTLAVNSPVAVQLNGVTASSQEVVAGSSVQVNAPAGSSYWQFAGWSDGGPPAHAFTMPNADLTLTAAYQTAIDAKYAALGGAASLLRAPTSLEYDIAAGRGRNYQTGRLYWSAASGAHESHGGILSKYLAKNGPKSFGFPTTDEIAVPGGKASYFERGNIYWSKANGAHFTRGAIRTKYLALGGPRKYGLPKTDDTKVSGGYYTLFSGGRAIFQSGKGTFAIYGPILKKYASKKYQKSCLGFPTSDQYKISGGVRNKFAHGTITYKTKTKKTTFRCS